MTTLKYAWGNGGAKHEMALVPVQGSAGKPYLFGAGANRRPIDVRDFYVGTTPVTQALWQHVMGENPSKRPDPRCPVENVSWNDIHRPGGFLERINASEIVRAIAGSDATLKFRLPSETEWEYAARGGPHWTDDFAFAGSNDIDTVAWYSGLRYSPARWWLIKKFGIGWGLLGGLRIRDSRTHDVATKKPNQLGIYDMCGNVWEWCQDASTDDRDAVPRDGTPWLGQSDERRLRGGCHHNWDIHCQVWWRYGIAPDAHDGCIGFRLVLAPG